MKNGTAEERMPQDRDGRFHTPVFERYRRSDKALVAILIEMVVKGTSTRKVAKLVETLCGHTMSPSTISNLVVQLDEALQAFASRRLDDTSFRYLLVDARFEKVHKAGAVHTRAMLIAIGIDADGKRHVLGVELADRASDRPSGHSCQAGRNAGCRGSN